MNPLSSAFLRPLAAAITFSLLPSLNASAQTIYVGGLDSFFMKGDPVAGNFQFIGACGGSIQSMTESYQELYLGDVGGRVYVYHGNTGSTNYLFDSPNDATALLDYGGALLVGGSDGTVHLIDKRDGSVEETFNCLVPVGAMLRVGDTLYVGSPTLDVMEIDLPTGNVSLLGTCAGQIHSMALDNDHLVLGTPQQGIYRMDINGGWIDAGFGVTNDATAMLMHDGDLLVGGTDRSIIRINPLNGSVISSLTSIGNDVSAMAISPDEVEPGFPYCFGLDCPCANNDALSGCANSLGKGASMHALGSSSVQADDLVLTVNQLPPGAFAVIYMGSQANNISFGDGILCAGAGYPLFRFPIQNSGAAGVITLGPGIVDHSQQHFGSQGEILPSSTWLWQIWYRNPVGPCGGGFNTSNGYTVSFTP